MKRAFRVVQRAILQKFKMMLYVQKRYWLAVLFVMIVNVVQNINIPVLLQVLYQAETLVLLVVKRNIQLVPVIAHILGKAGPALAQVHINMLAQERATLAARVLLAAENIRLVVVLAGMYGKMGLALAIKLARSAIFCTPITLVVLAM